jgi:hypothetical protein
MEVTYTSPVKVLAGPLAVGLTGFSSNGACSLDVDGVIRLRLVKLPLVGECRYASLLRGTSCLSGGEKLTKLELRVAQRHRDADRDRPHRQAHRSEQPHHRCDVPEHARRGQDQHEDASRRD